MFNKKGLLGKVHTNGSRGIDEKPQVVLDPVLALVACAMTSAGGKVWSLDIQALGTLIYLLADRTLEPPPVTH